MTIMLVNILQKYDLYIFLRSQHISEIYIKWPLNHCHLQTLCGCYAGIIDSRKLKIKWWRLGGLQWSDLHTMFCKNPSTVSEVITRTEACMHTETNKHIHVQMHAHTCVHIHTYTHILILEVCIYILIRIWKMG